MEFTIISVYVTGVSVDSKRYGTTSITMIIKHYNTVLSGLPDCANNSKKARQIGIDFPLTQTSSSM